MSKRTVFLLLATLVCGAGGGLILTFAGGLYGAMMFVAFPFVAALLLASIAYDIGYGEAVAQVAQPRQTAEAPANSTIIGVTPSKAA
jgi:hypothetical protein